MNIEEMKNKMKSEYKLAMSKLDKEINVLEAKIESTSEKGKIKLVSSLNGLKNQRDELGTKLTEIEKASENTLEDLKEKTDNMVETIERKKESLKQSIKETVAAW